MSTPGPSGILVKRSTRHDAASYFDVAASRIEPLTLHPSFSAAQIARLALVEENERNGIREDVRCMMNPAGGGWMLVAIAEPVFAVHPTLSLPVDLDAADRIPLSLGEVTSPFSACDRAIAA